MKPAPFAYARARSLAEVFDLLEQHGSNARILAGGQSLLPTLAMRLSEPELLVDITGLKELRFVEERGGAVHLGALARHRDLETSPVVAAKLPLVAQAMPHIAHPAIRNRGTLGGSLALADPAAELPACMVALEATLVLGSRSGERSVRAGDFFRGLYETDLRPGELLVRVEITPEAGWRYHFAEVSRRLGDYAIVGLAAARGPGAEVRFTYFGCGGRPVRAHGAEAAARSGPPSSAYERLRAALEADLDPPADLHAAPATRRHLAAVLAQRAVAALRQ